MKWSRCLVPAVVFTLLFAWSAFGAVVSPTGVTLEQSSQYYSVLNLIDGGGTVAGATWVTDAPGGWPSDYFEYGPDPIIVFDLGADMTIDTMLTWPYSNYGNSARELTLRFATEADGVTNFATSVTFTPTFIIPGGTAGTAQFGQEVTVRYVEMTITDNYFDPGDAGAGGDRAGMAEVAFETAPSPPEAPALIVQPQGVATFVGSEVTFAVAADGTQPFNYQWRKNGSTLPGATDPDYVIVSALETDAGDYDVLVSNSQGSVTSETARLLVSPVPISPADVILVQSSEPGPVINLVDGGGTAPGGVWYTDAPNGSDDYFLDTSPGPDPIIIFDLGADTGIESILVWPYGTSGNSARDFDLQFATEADGTNGFGTSITFSPDFIAPDQPQADPGTRPFNELITARYVKMTITDNYYEISPPGGDRVGMSEVAFGPPLGPGVAPVVLGDPASVATEFGSGDVAFSVDVFGSQPFFFQWRKDGVDLAGENDITLVLPSPGFDEQGGYDVVVTNSGGAVTSQVATLTVMVAPVSPTGQGVLQGATATFAIATDADTYQWAKDGVDLSGETNQDLVLGNVQPGDAGTYTVYMTIGASYASTTGDPAVLTVLDPAGRSDYELLVLSHTPRGYWRLGETSGTSAIDETGHHHGEYFNAPNLGEPGVVTGDADTAVGFTQSFQTKVEVPFSADLNGESFSVECWAQVTGGSGHRSPLTSRDDGPQQGYIFYVEPDGRWDFWTGPGWHNMNGPTVATVDEWFHLVGTYDAATRTKTFYINGEVEGVQTGVTLNPNDQQILRIGAGETDSDPGNFFFEGPIDEVAVYGDALPLEKVRAHFLLARFGGNSPPFIDVQPEDQPLVLGDTNAVITFDAVVSGSPPLFLQWSKGGLPMPGEEAAILVISNAIPADVGTYALTASNDLGVAVSDPADLYLTTGPVVPAGLTRIEGDNARFTVTMPEDSTGYVYQWKKNGADIPGATTDTLELLNLGPADTDTYTVEVTLSPDVATSAPVALAVVPLASDTYANLVGSSGPLVWWRLGEAADATIALDEYGFNNAYILADTVMGAPGALLGDASTAAEFPGATDSKVELDLTFDIATPEFTVEFWALSAGGTGFRSPATSRDIYEGEISGWTFYLTSDNTWQFRIGDGGATWAGVIDGPPAVQGAWTHVVGTYDGSNMRLYVDGAMVGELSGVPYLPQDYTPLWIGAGATEDLGAIGNFFWVGRIDEVAFYDRGISATEVRDHWSAAFQPGTAPVITGEPQFAWALPGGDASFSVAARGTPLLQYQWRKGGVDLPGATEPTLMVSDVDLADSGLYSAIVSNSGGTASSASAELYIPPPLSGPYQDLVLADGPMAYWPLDEASGAVATDVVGTNDGDVVNSPNLGEAGAIPGDAGTSFLFTQGAGQKVEVPYSPVMNPTTFTVEAWAAVTGGSGHRSPLTSRGDFPQRGYIFYCVPNDSWEFWTGTGVQGAWLGLGWGQGPVTYGEWYHLVGSYDGTTLRFYVNGQLVASQDADFAPSDSNVLRIGAGATDQDPGDFFFDGGIDEVAIYDKVLDIKQIVQHYAAGVPKELIPMDINLQGGVITVIWGEEGVLQQTEDLPGESWTDVTGSPSSPYSDSVPVDHRSFRLREP